MNKLNKTFKINPLYESDGYKVGHKSMLAEGTTRLYGTWIPRSLKYMPGGIDKIMSAGQQLVIRYLHSSFKENFFDRDSSAAITFSNDMSKYLGLDYNGTHFLDLYNLGYLPIKIKALPEGIFTEPNIPHMTFVNTVDGYAWLTLFLETYISKLAWQMPTAATIGHKFRQNANEWVAKTDKENLWLSAFMCHDFHSRGGNPFTSIAVGLGHAISNSGSDTLNVIPAARYYYDESDDSMPIYSVNASEHSVSTTKIFTVGEKQMILDWIKIFPKGILSWVIDTFSTWEAIKLAGECKEEILSRDGKLVFRPDSGNPVDIICGYKTTVDKEYLIKESDIIPYYRDIDSGVFEIDSDSYLDTYTEYCSVDNKTYKVTVTADIGRTHDHNDNDYYCFDGIESVKYEEVTLPEAKGVVELLWDIFGGTINELGYKVLDSHVGTIYGDSINLERQVEIYRRLEAKGFAASNVVLGVGSFTYVMLTRDSAGYAAKGSWFEIKESHLLPEGTVNMEDSDSMVVSTTQYNIYKDPITDDGQKRSLRGLLQVTEDLKVKQECTWEEEAGGLLRTIYEDGNFYNQETLTTIRERVTFAK